MSKIGRNQPCPCGSGRKFKKCCRVRSRIGEASSAAAAAPEPEYEVRTVGAARVRELLDFDPRVAQDLELRWYVVLDAVPGFGLFLAELDEHGDPGGSHWVENEEASYVFDSGNVFTQQCRAGDPIRIPPLWETCSECQQRIADGRRSWGAAAV